MLAILLCWALGGLIGLVWGIIQKAGSNEATKKEEEGAGESFDFYTLSVLKEAFRATAPNSRARGSVDLMNLSTLIQKIEAGEGVPEGLPFYLLSRIEGAERYAEKLKPGAGA